jgi:hypothetical protein
MTSLADSHIELPRFAITERDAFHDCATGAEGNLADPADQIELGRMDQMIDSAQAFHTQEEQCHG